jgi:phospholipid transport system transporter-binding protein
LSGAIEITMPAPGRVLVSGELTFATAREARLLGVKALSATSAAKLVVDCSGVSRGDSAGLAVVLDWLGWARQNQRELRLANLPLAILAIARISEVDDLLLGNVS